MNEFRPSSSHLAQLNVEFDLLHLQLSVADHLLHLGLHTFHPSLDARDRTKSNGPVDVCVDARGRLPATRRVGAHLPVVALSLHRDDVVGAVVGFGAQHTNAPLVAPAEELQEPLVLLAHPLLQHGHRLRQPVGLQGGDSQVRLQVAPAERGEAHEAGPQSLTLPPHTHVTTDGIPRHAVSPSGSDLLRDLFSEGVLAQLGADAVRPVAFGTADGDAVLPVGRDAGEAEAVPAGDGGGLGEDVPTDAALELHL